MARTRVWTLTATAALLAGLTTVAGCDAGDRDPEHVDVAAAFYPLQFVAERVGGDEVRVTALAQPGAEPHDLELTPRQVATVVDAELVVYLRGFQPTVDEAVAQNAADRAFDVATVEPLRDVAADHEDGADLAVAHEHEGIDGKDPHVWLDPTRLATIADSLARRLAAIDPQHAAGYAARARDLRADLDALDREYADGLRTCQRRELVTSHEAFGYLAARYGLEQVGIAGLTPEQEPAPRRLAAVAEEAQAHGATTIFFETLVSPKVARTIAHEVGARTAVLDPIEGQQPDATGDYLTVMRANLAALRTALGCS
ncbi:metal ABC transporter substrate-binding protein [Plantactinospora sp. KBS50]|uniref:metal ABC transporter substrate-binding protein n=1 Tax=Plantactinospora sp. KBS50 TaxID=2024580 RepID=UPI000BAAC6EC|nr:metal ABC transporter substrate-binding protein [Plantactinospora sp. KBS50]ASW56240.1 zinc ABC transporter substrate-binding protein [Plantactinospora sp. KBS50]